jgi:NAD(P)-dependent dehydrogenase (short-subunit alcohol dehydrogenase family)
MTGRLQDKVALVVGAGSVGPGWGNGKATAVLFARQGARVWAVDIAPAAVQETVRIIQSEGGTARPYVADVTDGRAVEELVAACLGAFGRIDVLFNNVGGSEPGGPVELSEEAWDRQMDHNLRYVYLTCKHVLPVMERQGSGAIVNMSSIAALRHFGPDLAAYAAAKAAVIQFTRVVAVKYAAKGIRLNTIVPGLMHTPLVEQRLARQWAGGDAEGLVRARHQKPPMGRMGDAWDVAHAALFLASDEAKYITGTELVVDGGLSATSR